MIFRSMQCLCNVCLCYAMFLLTACLQCCLFMLLVSVTFLVMGLMLCNIGIVFLGIS